MHVVCSCGKLFLPRGVDAPHTTTFSGGIMCVSASTSFGFPYRVGGQRKGYIAHATKPDRIATVYMIITALL